MRRQIIGSLLSLLAFASVASAATHPVLESFGLRPEDVPHDVYLVRSQRPLPSDIPLDVLARGSDTVLIAATPGTLEALTERGFPFLRIDPTLEAPTIPPRYWDTITEPDPRIQTVVDAVEWDRVRARIQQLQHYGTRWSFSSQCDVAADWLYGFFEARDLPTEFHHFELLGKQLRNVVATQVGVVHPDSVLVVCGHYDSLSDHPETDAPGADDNASGVTGVLTAADLLSQLSFEYTIKYICFSGEEQGRHGSRAYAKDARDAGMAIIGAVNFDMLGYWSDRRPMDFDLDLEANEASAWLMEAVVNAARLYTDMPCDPHVYNAASWSDHASFWDFGYAGVNNEEAFLWTDDDFNQASHSLADRLELIDEDFAVGSVKVAVAAVATLARLLDEPTKDESPSIGSLKGSYHRP